jgi:hypothetical protein
MSYSIELLDVVAAVRSVLSVAKSLQDKFPQAKPSEIAVAIEGVVGLKLARLQAKVMNLTEAQRASMYALTNAKQVLPDVQALLEKARERTGEEMADGMALLDTKAAKALAAKEARIAAKPVKAPVKAGKTKSETKDMFADA